MALETLKDVKEIGGFKVAHLVDNQRVEVSFERTPILVNHNDNRILFQIQNGPIKEVGENGCQIDTVIEAAKLILEGFQKQFPCRETAIMITKLDEALMWSEKRKKDREKRGVEGLGKE